MDVLEGVDPRSFTQSLKLFEGLGLVSEAETAEVLAMLGPSFPFAEAVAAAASIHLHVKVPDTSALPHDVITAAGSKPTSCTEGYIKYPFPGGISMIFSSIPISEDDLLEGDEPLRGAVLDHKGIDLRSSAPAVRALFDTVPAIAARQGWRHRAQGGDGTPVYCCHTEVAGKHWVYPSPGEAGQNRPIEFAIGELVIHDFKMGCDLRPIDPADPRADDARAGCPPVPRPTHRPG
jgi:hypothetical protein